MAGSGRPYRTANPEVSRRVERLRRLAHLLDDRFAIPGTRYRIGIDGLVGLVPGIGDAVTTVLALYLVLEARRLGVPAGKLARMGLNVGVDAVLGAVPLVGDLFDMAWKANRRNLHLLLDHLEAADRKGHRDRTGDKRHRSAASLSEET